MAHATFEAQSPLRAELTRRVNAYLAETGQDERGGAEWVVKALVEHQLFPRVGQRHHRALAKLTQEVCREQGVTYRQLPTVRAAVLAHLRLLRHVGSH